MTSYRHGQARAALANDRALRPESWNTYGQSRDGGPKGESGRWQQHTLLSDSIDFDCLSLPRSMS